MHILETQISARKSIFSKKTPKICYNTDIYLGKALAIALSVRRARPGLEMEVALRYTLLKQWHAYMSIYVVREG